MKKQIFRLAIFISASHFLFAAILYLLVTQPPPDYDMINIFPQTRLFYEDGRYKELTFVVPSIFFPYVNGGVYFYAGPLWWFITIIMSIVFGMLSSFVFYFIKDRVFKP